MTLQAVEAPSAGEEQQRALLWDKSSAPARLLVPFGVEKPVFHVAPRQGWVNDPNGPLVFRGKYHLFYQHLDKGCEWAFGLVWGHCVSSDLVHWEHLPHAIVPTPGTLDADGCFSGCACVDTDGTPTLLYTGVRLRSNPDVGPLPPPESDLNLPFVETQLAAVADAGDDLLLSWRKDAVPFIHLPPPDMDLTGWRDPFVLEEPGPSNNHEWVIVIGSGLKNVGGTALVYRSASLRDPARWRYDGLLCVGDGDTGAVWECPLLCRLQPLPPVQQRLPHHTLGLPVRCASWQRLPPVSEEAANTGGWGAAGGALADGPAGKEAEGQGSDEEERCTHFYSISPDACTNPSIYWLGPYRAGRFDIDNAEGPHRLDLGDVLYAPNLMHDRGRTLLWGWAQERRPVGAYDYAGCMTTPRVLHRDGARLWQEPVPELRALRSGEAWHETDVQLLPEQPVPLPRVGGAYLDLELSWRPGSATSVGVLLRSWNAGGEGGAAVLYNWDTCTLEVVFEALDPATMDFSLTSPGARHIGGQLDARPGDALGMRLLLDYSLLEVYTSTGQVLTTRVYRGLSPTPEADAGIEFVALDGTATLARVAAWEMRSIWKADVLSAAGEGADVAASAAPGAAAAAAAAAGGSLPGTPRGVGGAAPAFEAAAAAAAADKAAGGVPVSLSRPLSRAGSLVASDLQAGALLSPAASAQSAAAAAASEQRLPPPPPPLLLYGGAGAGLPAEFFDEAAMRASLLPEEEMTADIFLDLMP